MGLPSRTLRTAAAAFALFALSGGAAPAAAWSPPRTLATLNGYAPAPALAPDGRALVLMSDYGSGTSRMLMTSRARGGAWSRPTTVRRSRHELIDPAAAFTSAGDALLAWVRAPRLDQVQVVEARTLFEDGRLGRTARVSGARDRAIFPTVAAGPGGRALLVWQDAEYRLAVADGGAGGFGDPQTVFGGRQFAYRVAHLPGGGAVAVSHAFGPGGVRVAVRDPGGAWSRPAVLSGPRTAREPALAVGPDGTVAVAWAQHTEGGYRIQYSLRPPGGAFGAPATAGDGRGPAVSFAQDGTLVMAWVGSTRSSWLLRGGEIVLGVAQPGAAVARLARLGGRGSAIMGAPSLFTDRDGDTLVVWGERGRRSQTVSAVRAADGTVGPVERVGATGARVVANGAGDALAVWISPGPRRGPRVQVAERRF